MDDEQQLIARINSETGRLSWPELQRHFARGVVIRVARELDLVQVALNFTRDEHETVSGLLAEGHVARANDDDARDWEARDPLFWAVVVAPWVLVQEIE